MLERKSWRTPREPSGIKAAVRAGVDSIEHGTMLDEEGAQLMEEHHTWLVPTLYCFQHDMETGLSKGRDPDSYAKGVEIIAAQGPAFKLALAHHIRIVYGVDDDDVDESVSKEFSALVRGGLSPLGALQAATINAATMLGKDKDVGTLEPGRFADIVAVSGRPARKHHRDGARGLCDAGRSHRKGSCTS